MYALRFAGIVLFAALLLTQPAAAADHVILQQDKSFIMNGAQIEELKITAGDTLTFVNKDLVTHNVYSRDAGNEFEIPKQEPGVKASVTLKNPGQVHIRCAIHPKMKMVVTVEPAR